ncbi:MAG: peptidase M23 [Deltaproteobacteria bacterium]|nr:MAG: peptidase M23 [Deltaproteobacteria bacterium]
MRPLAGIAVAGILLGLLARPVQARNLESIEARRQSVKKRLKELQAEEGAVLAVLEQLEQRLLTERAALEAAEAKVQEATASLEAIRAERDRTQVRLARRLREMAPRLRVRYKLGRAGYLPALLSAGSIDEFRWRQRMLSYVIRSDLRRIAEIRRLRVRLRKKSEQLDRARRALEDLRASASARLADLETAKAERDGALEAIREEQALQRKTLAELERARRQLLARLEGLAPGRSRGFASLKGRLPRPAVGAIEEGFGARRDPRYGSVTFHKGIDIRAPRGTKVRAVASGTVVHARWMRGYGNLVILDHGGGYYTLMAHLDRMEVKEGDAVEAGDVVGLVGDTGSLKGAYLYFEIREAGKAVDPVPWFAR